jgi:hypothetical protein
VGQEGSLRDEDLREWEAEVRSAPLTSSMHSHANPLTGPAVAPEFTIFQTAVPKTLVNGMCPFSCCFVCVAVQVGALRRTRSKLLLEVDQVRYTIPLTS